MTSKEKIKNIEKERDYYKMQIDVIHQLIQALKHYDDYSEEASEIRGTILHLSDLSYCKRNIDYIIEHGHNIVFFNDCYSSLSFLDNVFKEDYDSYFREIER